MAVRGGAQIPVSNALFDVVTYDGAIVSDLFGEERYFADSDAFWTAQNAAIADKAQAYREAGWKEVVLLEAGEHFQSWNHQKTAKSKAGNVFVALSADGEVTFHEGWLYEKEVERKAKAVQVGNDDALQSAKAGRCEITKPMQNYLTLHRHAAVRTELLAHTGLALRLIAAHMIAGS
jgi:ParB family chromosome partitioning protein